MAVTRSQHAVQHLSAADPVVASLIEKSEKHWSPEPASDPIFQLIRIIVAQQISTKAALTIIGRVRQRLPFLTAPPPFLPISREVLQTCGVPARKAKTCIEVAEKACVISGGLERGVPVETVLNGYYGIGPWTLAMFRIFALKEPDVEVRGDIGLLRAIRTHYGPEASLAKLGSIWSPFKAVAYWYLWRSLGNPPLG
jgi:DNA-3-methyladenine glycosylase II